MEEDGNSKFEIKNTYEQKQSDFDTIFEYNLENKENFNVAKEGLSDLIRAAPVTLTN